MTIRIAPITDMALVRSTITTPHIWDALTDDADGDPSAFNPSPIPTTTWLGAWDEDEFLGMFILRYLSAACGEAHIALLPNCGGFRALRAYRAVMAWAWANTKFSRIIGATPSNNAKALKFVRLAGFIEFGRNPKAWLKNGQLFDLVMTGVNRGR